MSSPTTTTTTASRSTHLGAHPHPSRPTPSTINPTTRSHSNNTLSTIRTLGRKSFSDLRRAFKNPYYPTPTSNIEIITKPPLHPPIAVPFVPHRNAPAVHLRDEDGGADVASFMLRQDTSTGTGTSTPSFGFGFGDTPSRTRTNSIYSGISRSMSMTFSAAGSGSGAGSANGSMTMGMTSSVSMGEMWMPVDVHRLSGALSIVTLDLEGRRSGLGGGGKKVNRGARLCETGSGDSSPI